MIRDSIRRVIERKNLTAEEAARAMNEIMAGEATPPQIASFLTALRMKGETVAEITAFARIMRERSLHINPRIKGTLLDTAGTGGDRIKTFNISTCAAFVLAGAGVPVAKHGNRAVTSACGSADLLESFGLSLDSEPSRAEEAVEKIGIGFLYAPAFHPAMKYAAPVRREIGVRTVFNILGPLSSPAHVSYQILGVYDPALVKPVADVLSNLRSEGAMVFHGLDGLDEISTIGATKISQLRNGAVDTFETKPEDFGVRRAEPRDVEGSSLEKNVETAFKIISGVHKDGPKVDAVLVNVSAGLVVSGDAEHFATGVEIGRESIESGRAYKKLKDLVRFHKGSTSKLEELEKRFA